MTWMPGLARRAGTNDAAILNARPSHAVWPVGSHVSLFGSAMSIRIVLKGCLRDSFDLQQTKEPPPLPYVWHPSIHEFGSGAIRTVLLMGAAVKFSISTV